MHVAMLEDGPQQGCNNQLLSVDGVNVQKTQTNSLTISFKFFALLCLILYLKK